MRTKSTIAIVVLVLVFYAALIGFKGVALLAGGSVVGKVLGLALLLTPLLRLALAYDAAGDRTRARAAARHAVDLHS
jgi:hypothetical protein